MKKDPCQKKACDIQFCLQKNNYQESKCNREILALVECCLKWRNESPVVCKGIKLPEEKQEKPIV